MSAVHYFRHRQQPNLLRPVNATVHGTYSTAINRQPDKTSSYSDRRIVGLQVEIGSGLFALDSGAQRRQRFRRLV